MSARTQAVYADLEPVLKQELAPQLQVIRYIGHGAMAGVFLGREADLKRLVAIKVMSPDLARDERARLRFEREAQSAASISHPNVISVHRIGRLSTGVPYIVMEYVKGRNLAELLAAHGAFAVDAVAGVVADVAAALSAAHRKGIVHRDVKPANVMKESDSGRVILTDFGIAAILESGEQGGERLTRAGEVLGDPTYISPEQLNGEDVTERSDVFALGILACELLTGRGADDKPALQRQRLMALRNDPAKLVQLRPDVDPALATLIGRCLARSPAHRPDARDVARLAAHPAEVTLSDTTSPGISLEERPKGFLGKLRERRMPQIVGAYAAGGWAAIQVIELLAEEGVLPELATKLSIVAFSFGLPGAFLLAWFHGKPGPQTLHPIEIWLHLALIFGWLAVSAIVLTG